MNIDSVARILLAFSRFINFLFTQTGEKEEKEAMKELVSEILSVIS